MSELAIASAVSTMPPATAIITVHRTDSTRASTLMLPITPARHADRSISSLDGFVPVVLVVVDIGKGCGEAAAGNSSGVTTFATTCILFERAAIGADG